MGEQRQPALAKPEPAGIRASRTDTAHAGRRGARAHPHLRQSGWEGEAAAPTVFDAQRPGAPAHPPIARRWAAALGGHEYLRTYISWWARKRSRARSSFSSSGRKVSRRWCVPSRCPKPDPGTAQMPVCSSSDSA